MCGPSRPGAAEPGQDFGRLILIRGPPRSWISLSDAHRRCHNAMVHVPFPYQFLVLLIPPVASQISSAVGDTRAPISGKNKATDFA